MKIVLASSSPQRKKLIEQLGVSCIIIEPDIDETARANESPESFVERLSQEKAAAVYQQAQTPADALIIAADTIVLCGEQILGKPSNQAEAKQMLRQLSGRSHLVLTAVTCQQGKQIESAVSSTSVLLRELKDEELQAYLQSGESLGKAGAYGIQGIAAAFVEHIEGSYSGVMGLPLCLLSHLIARFNISLLALSEAAHHD